MTSSFFGLSIGTRALAAQRQALETVSHNIANATAPGYSRQQSMLVASTPFTFPLPSYIVQGGQLGTGVVVASTRRLRDAFLDGLVRRETLELGSSEARRDTLQRVENVFNEPSDSGLQVQLQRFWSAWHDLANDPMSSAQRAALRERARDLADSLNRAFEQLDATRRDLNAQIALRVDDVNSIAAQIADLNRQIGAIEATGNDANDLRDARDRLLDQMARLLPVDTVEAPNGQISVYLQGQALVQEDRSVRLLAASNPSNAGNTDLSFDGSTFLAVPSGQIGGLQAVRDTDLADQLAGLDELAIGLRDAVNSQHQLGLGLDGLGGRDFFAGSGAADLALSADVEASLDAIAAAAPGEGRAGSGNALAIAALQSTPVAIGSQTEVLGDFYRALIAALGVASQSAANAASNQDLLVRAAENQRQAVSGVSIDEEAARMVEFQRAYEAAARVVTVFDEMLDKLINGTGLVGR